MIGTTLDLSAITDRLLDLLQSAVDNSPLWTVNGGSIDKFSIAISGSMPEGVRNEGNCQLTVYLFHLSADPYARNTPIGGPVAQPNLRQPLGLTLYFLVSAYSKDRPEQEQQAMSIAIKALHEHASLVDRGKGLSLSIALESEKPDDAVRRWQSFSTPYRLSAVYRAGVVFLSPESQPPTPAAPPRRLGLAAGPAALPFAAGGALIGTAIATAVDPFPPPPGAPTSWTPVPTPVSTPAPPGGSVRLYGSGLDRPTVKRLYLLEPDGTERDISAWVDPTRGSAASLTATLPETLGVPPTGCPPPGIYLLRAGISVAAGDAADYRSNAVALTLCAKLSPVPEPWLPTGGIYSFGGAGFLGGATELLLDAIALAPLAPGTPPGAGEFSPNGTGTAIDFRPPVTLAAGTYSVRVRVKGVEGAPVGSIVLP